MLVLRTRLGKVACGRIPGEAGGAVRMAEWAWGVMRCFEMYKLAGGGEVGRDAELQGG